MEKTKKSNYDPIYGYRIKVMREMAEKIFDDKMVGQLYSAEQVRSLDNAFCNINEVINVYYDLFCDSNISRAYIAEGKRAVLNALTVILGAYIAGKLEANKLEEAICSILRN